MKAIIPAAGHGTRFLPVTRVIPKEMLPIGAKPALELIVDEARRAGADEIVLVISKGKDLIRTYFEGDPSIRFVYQQEQKGLGHAVLQAEEAVRAGSDGHVLILLGDALVAGCDASSEMVALSKAHGGTGVIGLERVPREKVSRYGIVKPKKMLIPEVEAVVEIGDLVEKPKPEEAPSDMAVAGRYLLDVKIFDYLRDQKAGVGGEIQLTDAIRRMLGPTNNQRHPTNNQRPPTNNQRPPTNNQRPPTNNQQPTTNNLFGYVYPGKRQDIGNPKGYFEALKAMGENE